MPPIAFFSETNCAGRPRLNQDAPRLFDSQLCRGNSLMRGYEMRSPVLLPARFIMLAAERPLFAPADRIHSRGGNAERDQVILCGLGGGVTETNVVFRGTTLIAMAFDGYANLRVRPQKLGRLGQIIACIGANIGLVKVEESVLHILLE